MTNDWFDLWASNPKDPHGQTARKHGTMQECMAEKVYLEAMARLFEGREPYPYLEYSIERA